MHALKWMVDHAFLLVPVWIAICYAGGRLEGKHHGLENSSSDGPRGLWPATVIVILVSGYFANAFGEYPDAQVSLAACAWGCCLGFLAGAGGVFAWQGGYEHGLDQANDLERAFNAQLDRQRLPFLFVDPHSGGISHRAWTRRDRKRFIEEFVSAALNDDDRRQGCITVRECGTLSLSRERLESLENAPAGTVDPALLQRITSSPESTDRLDIVLTTDLFSIHTCGHRTVFSEKT